MAVTAAQVAAERARIGLDPDPVSDNEWASRPWATIADIRPRLQAKLNTQLGDEMSGNGAPPANGEAGAPAGNDLAPSNLTANAIIANLLREYGLEFTPTQVAEWVGLLTDDPQNISLVEEEIRGSKTFKDRFPGIDARVAGGLNAISVNEYLELEDTYRSIFRNAGLPLHFYDEPGELADFIAKDVSPGEMEARVTKGIVAARNAPQEVRDALSQFYGIGNTDGALTAYYLDPDKGLDAIQREFESATIAGAAAQVGFGAIDVGQAERLQSLGVSGDQARQGFSELERSQELVTAGVGEVGGDTLTQQQQIDATFEQDADLMERIRRQRERRGAAFAGSDAGATTTQAGVTGLKTAST